MLKTPESFLLRPLSPIQTTIQGFFDKFHESGIRQYWRSVLPHSQRRFDVVQENELAGSDFLSLDDLLVLFYLLFASHALSTVVFAFEITKKTVREVENFCR